MPIIAVNLIKVAFVVALYAFLLYVARSMRGYVAGPPVESLSPAKRQRHPNPTEDEPPPPSVTEVVIEVFDASESAVRHTIRDAVIVGRGSSADIRIDDEYASDRHASFRVVSGRLTVEDLGSTNGTTIEGMPLTGTAEVRSGTTLVLGRTKVVVI